VAIAMAPNRPAASVPQPLISLSPSFTLPNLRTVGRVKLLMLAGAAPVSSIPIYILGWVPMTYLALCFVVPLALVAVGMMARRSPEGVWAARGAGAGLVAVSAYDAVRLPLVWLNIWPDFIPRLGGWIVGDFNTHIWWLGYTWRYLGDGAGIGLSYFVFVAAAMAVRPVLVVRFPFAVSIGYGVFVWTGLLATVELLARGQDMLFHVNPINFSLSLLGHLIYGSVLGLYLRHYIRKDQIVCVNDAVLTIRLPVQRSAEPTVLRVVGETEKHKSVA